MPMTQWKKDVIAITIIVAVLGAFGLVVERAVYIRGF
jgi:hypothetical protein